MKNRTIDEATARRLSVQANVDPRTLRKVLKGEKKTNSQSAQRARAILIEVGLLSA